MNRWFLDENDIDIYLKCADDDVRWHYNKKELVRILNDLEAKLEDSKNKLNRYPYKNEVIEEQYEGLKNGIKFRIDNNITDDWEQLYRCFDVLCEKHKARIIDIENGICRIEQLKQQLAEKDEVIANWRTVYKNVVQTCHNDKEEIKRLNKQLVEKDEQLKNAIVLNLKVGQEVYVIENKNIFKDVLEEIEITEDGILFYVEEGIYGFEENEIFATKEEAQAKLEELQGEK